MTSCCPPPRMRWSGATDAIARCKRVSTGCGRKPSSAHAWRWICGVKPKGQGATKPSTPYMRHGLPEVTRYPCYSLERQVIFKKTGEVREAGVAGVTSLVPERADAARLLTLVRGQWQIENQSHWVRDVTFDEDRSQVRCGHLPQVMAALRNTVIGLMRWAGYTNMAAACRRFAAQPTAALHLIGIALEN